MAKKTKSLFDHLSGIREKKVKWESLSELDKKSFTPYTINRFLSMDVNLIGVVNDLQKYTIGTLTSKDVYKLYHDFLPKRKSYDKYIKGDAQNKHNDVLLRYLTEWYSISKREVIDYLEILSKEEVTAILVKYGLTSKEIKKILK